MECRSPKLFAVWPAGKADFEARRRSGLIPAGQRRFDVVWRCVDVLVCGLCVLCLAQNDRRALRAQGHRNWRQKHISP